MQNAANRAKTRWNAANYTQIKAYVAPETASAFKAACADARTSMNSVLSQLMADYCDKQVIKKSPNKAGADFLSTKGKRRKKHEELLGQYIKPRDAQEHANDNVPENFRGTENFEEAEEAVRMMDEAIEILEGIY
jgi:hypothetical protein